MSRSQAKPGAIPRAEVIALLRTELLKHTDSETSACRFASDAGVFCRGFSQFTDDMLRRKYDWITRRRPDISREDLEEIANRWQLARQDVCSVAVACDVQQMERDMCNGWDDFSNADLSNFYNELTGNNIIVI